MNDLRPRRFWSVSCALALAAALGAQQGAAAPPAGDYEAALARYRECLGRLVFRFHTEGRETLARTHRPEALALLAADYARVKEHTEHARYTLATILGRHFTDPESVAALAALRRAHGRPADAWLWMHTLRIETDRTGDAEALRIVREDGDAVHRAAAITALGRARNADLAAAIAATCAAFPRKEADRNVLLGAMSGAIFENKGRLREAAFKAAVADYVRLLAPAVKLSHTAKIQIARHLMWSLNGPALFIDPEPWLALLERGVVDKPEDTHTVVRPRFFGVESDGERLCYVVDMSDSMCKEIDPAVRPKAAVTGPRKKPKGVLPDESDLPWDRIKTRFDLAREQLRISLLRLPKDKHFSIVWFGTESGTLDACKGMIPATKGNVDRVLDELDRIVPGPPDPVKSPDGALRGSTNMHSGLRRAFGLSDKGYVETAAFVDAAALTTGCDTIFLLSDGAPSWDDFSVLDKDYGEGKPIVDSEYGAAAPRQPRMFYWGPYDQPDWLVEDVQRMNAFRRISLHCVAIGEADTKLLGRLAEIGHGEVFVFGRGK